MTTKKDVKVFTRFLKEKRAYGSYVLEANKQKKSHPMFYNSKGIFRPFYSTIDEFNGVKYGQIAAIITQSLTWRYTKNPSKWGILYNDANNFHKKQMFY